jgi:hypothetical protein
VQSDCVRRLIVDTFDDVDLSVHRPVLDVDFPCGGPSGTTLRHVADVEDNDMLQVLLNGLDADALATYCMSRLVWYSLKEAFWVNVPGPAGSTTLVESARMMMVSGVVNVRFCASAVT